MTDLRTTADKIAESLSASIVKDVRRTRQLAGVGAFLVAAALSACTMSDDQPHTLDGWQAISLPDAMVPATMQLQQDRLLVAGHSIRRGSREPALAMISTTNPGSEPEPLTLAPTTHYAKIADLVSITSSGAEVITLGVAYGGAHANPRWTIWTGTADKVVDRPQTFETFGGWDAGTLIGLAVDTRGPLIMGTWQGTHGPDGAVWRAEGDRWVRQPSPPALRNTTTRQVSPRFVEQHGDGSVTVSGSVLDLTDGVRQSAVTWRDADGSWTIAPLPDPGKRSEAWSTACSQTCWTAGVRDDKLAVWSAGALLDIPDLPAADTDTAKVLLSTDGVIVATSQGQTGHLLISHDGKWKIYSSPDGAVQSATLVGSRLYLITGKDESRTLWVRDLSDVLA